MLNIGRISADEAVAQAAKRTRNYAKRQFTWFRKDKTIHWFDGMAADLAEQVQPIVEEFFERENLS